jgi:hypothetical protein
VRRRKVIAYGTPDAFVTAAMIYNARTSDPGSSTLGDINRRETHRRWRTYLCRPDNQTRGH